MQDRKVVT